MKTQIDIKVRMVALDNLRAMCERASGPTKQYEVSNVSRSRVTVTHHWWAANERHTASIVFPCYPSPHDGDKGPGGVYNPRVVLDPIGSINDPHGTAYQAVGAAITQAATLWMSPLGEWTTHGERLGGGRSASITGGKCNICTVCDVPIGPGHQHN
jgi:hypothetical protein